jgi:hypothetical protein
MPARYVPPSGFGYPRDGFLPSSPCRFCFTPAALMGFTLRSVPPSKGTRSVSASDEPTYRFTRQCSRRRSGRPAQRAPVPGFRPFRESLAPKRVFSSQNAGCSLGFRPSRVLHRRPWTAFLPPSSPALCRSGGEPPSQPAPQSLDRPPTRPSSKSRRSAPPRSGDPLRVRAPA